MELLLISDVRYGHFDETTSNGDAERMSVLESE
jgi:hypothetical protein